MLIHVDYIEATNTSRAVNWHVLFSVYIYVYIFIYIYIYIIYIDIYIYISYIRTDKKDEFFI